MGHRGSRVLGSLALALIAGCSVLAVRPDDGRGARTIKYVVRAPLSLLTLSASEFRIQAIELDSGFDAYVALQESKIAVARAELVAAESYQEYQELALALRSLEAELAERIAVRRAAVEAGLVPGPAPEPREPPEGAGCESRRRGDRIETRCR